MTSREISWGWNGQSTMWTLGPSSKLVDRDSPSMGNSTRRFRLHQSHRFLLLHFFSFFFFQFHQNVTFCTFGTFDVVAMEMTFVHWWHYLLISEPQYVECSCPQPQYVQGSYTRRRDYFKKCNVHSSVDFIKSDRNAFGIIFNLKGVFKIWSF